jgi:hypothetical protein
VLYGIAGLLGGLTALACLVTYTPPYAWVADAQLALMHTNLVAVSYVATFAVTSLPFLAVARVLEPRIDPSGKLARSWDGFDRFLDTWPGKTVMIGVTIAAMGGYLAHRDTGRGPLVGVDVRTLEQGAGPSCAYVELTHAHLAPEGRIEFRDGSNTHAFVPILSRDDGSRASVFALYREGIAPDAPLRGPLDQDDLPGEIRSAYEQAHVITTPHYVLDVGADPVERASFATSMALVGVVVAVIGIVIAAWKRFAV